MTGLPVVTEAGVCTPRSAPQSAGQMTLNKLCSPPPSVFLSVPRGGLVLEQAAT